MELYTWSWNGSETGKGSGKGGWEREAAKGVGKGKRKRGVGKGNSKMVENWSIRRCWRLSSYEIKNQNKSFFFSSPLIQSKRSGNEFVHLCLSRVVDCV